MSIYNLIIRLSTRKCNIFYFITNFLQRYLMNYVGIDVVRKLNIVLNYPIFQSCFVINNFIVSVGPMGGFRHLKLGRYKRDVIGFVY